MEHTPDDLAETPDLASTLYCRCCPLHSTTADSTFPSSASQSSDLPLLYRPPTILLDTADELVPSLSQPTAFDLMSRHSTTSTSSSRHAPSSGRGQSYQLVSPGTPTDPRAMSQVSPGFIFVIFLCPCACCSAHPFPLSFLSGL